MKLKSHLIASLCLVGIALLPAYAYDVPKATLPLVIYDEGDNANTAAYVPSGYEGNTQALSLDPDCVTMPHSGHTCLKVQYNAPTNWGGVVWQSPANDWGDKPGGWNLLGAKKLVFYARGETGSEVVSFSFGVLGADKTYHDTASGTLDKVPLSVAWKRYTIDLSNKDLSCIKTGFAFAVAGNGSPVTFYLDDIKYE